jgi:hypothetical protein
MVDETAASNAEGNEGAENGRVETTRATKATKKSKPTTSGKATKASNGAKSKTKLKAKSSEATKTNASSKKVKVASEDLPRRTLSESLPVTEALRNYANNKASWEEIAAALQVSAGNLHNKYPLWAAVAYGLVKQEGDQYSLAEVGRKIIAPEYEGEDQEGRLKAILTPRVMAQFYTDYNGNPLPPDNILSNVLENRLQIPRERVQEARNILIGNAREVGILRAGQNGNEVFQFSPSAAPPKPSRTGGADAEEVTASPPASIDGQARVQPESCFVITPIGEDGSSERKHADAVLKHLIEPVLNEVGIAALRADRITKPGIINKQIVAQLAYSKLCIADLSFNNPNAFYEMGVRHAFKLPMIQIIRKGDRIPFDVAPGRTIQIDCSDAYSVLDAFTSARKELKEHVESVLQGKVTSDDEPMALYLPGLKVTIPSLGSA